jgi:hypothetical protein
MAQLPDLAAAEVGAPTCFHGYDAGPHLTEKSQNLIPSELLAQHCPPRDVSAMRLKHILRKLEPDCGNLKHDRPAMWILANPPWHIDAVEGRSHHQSEKPSGLQEAAACRWNLDMNVPH